MKTLFNLHKSILFAILLLLAAGSQAQTVSYLWSNGATTPNIVVNPQETTTYYLTITQDGVEYFDSLVVTVTPPTVVAINGSSSVCLGFSTTLLATPGLSYLWSTGETMASITVNPSVNTTYSVEISDTNGCTGTAEINVIVNQPSTVTETASICGSYIWNGNTYTQSGTYTWTGTNASGCDSVVTLNLTITPQPEQPQLACWQTATFDAASCSWVISGTQPAEPTNLACYESAAFNSTTCEWEITGTQPVNWYLGGSSVPLPPLPCYVSFLFNDVTCEWEVTGTPAPAIVTNASACESYTWEVNGATYNTSGQYSFNSNCQDYTLNLTINQATASTISATITQGEIYNFNGQNLSTAGTYTATLQNAAGCDSVVTLNLTVEPAVEPLNCEITASETSICLNGQVNLSASYSGSIQSNSSATWQLIGNLPEARGSSAGYIDNGKIWIHAGANSVEMRPTSMYFDLGTNTSGFSSNIPFPRGEVGYGRVNDKFYVIGGYTGSSASNNTQEYDIENGTWTSKANMPTSRSVLSSAVLNNQLYVLGGWPGTQNTFERYTPESNTWETLPVIPTARHSVNSASAIDNKVYFLSGKDAWMTQFYNANECFDPATNSWQTKAPVPQPVYGGAAASHNGKLYLVGGSTGSYNSYINGSQTIYKTVQIYDPSTDTWTMGPELPVATSLATLISDGVDLYLVGGMSKNDNGSQWFISSSIYKLSNTSQTSILWSTGETTPSISVSPTETTTYSVTVTSGNQTCTSEVTITVNQPSAETVNASITQGETYNFNGQNLTTAGTYTTTLQNAAGCDSVVTLNLTVNPAPVAGCYAASVVSFNQGDSFDGTTVSAIRSNAELALGMPEPVVTNVVNFVSLGFGGSITLAFEGPIANGDGNDIRIDEATWNNNPCNRYPERADVFASQDGVNFVYLGVACQDASFDLGALSWAQYVRIVDISDLLSFSHGADGFDVNGIECLNGAATSLNDDGLVACSLQEIVSYTPGNRKNGTPVAAARSNPANALGTPQNNNTINFTALGFGGTMVAKFDYVVFNQPGNDLRVTETSFGNPSCNNYPEKARVSVSIDNVNWTELGEICQDGEIDLANVNYAQYIKIQDASPMSSNKFNGAADGYDVDAVVVLNNGCGTSSARLAQMDNTTTPDASLMISAFPNPMEDYTMVNFEGLENDSDFNFQIMDAAGRVIRNQNIRVTASNPTYLFDASELARGIYQVVIANDNGSNIIRLVK